MSLREIATAVREWTEREVPWGEAILLSVRRSAPRPPGARFAAAVDGTVAGTISAGCVEADLREHVLLAIESGAPALVTYGITDEMALGVGLSCGGEIEVLVRAADPADPVGPMLAASLENDGAAALLTGVSDNVRGARLLLRPDGTQAGGLGNAELDRRLADETSRLLAHEGSRLLDLDAGTVVFLDPVLPARRLVIVGATPVSEALSRMATLAGFRVVVVDPRTELARPERFPDAEVVPGWPDDAMAGPNLDPWTSVAVLSHEARLDVPALERALAAGCRYIGVLGGRRTQTLRREALVAAGASTEAVDRIRGPIGLDIGASTPAEIAVAVLAEIVAVRRGRMPGEP